MVQVLDIAEAEDRLLDLYNTMLIARGQMQSMRSRSMRSFSRSSGGSRPTSRASPGRSASPVGRSG